MSEEKKKKEMEENLTGELISKSEENSTEISADVPRMSTG